MARIMKISTKSRYGMRFMIDLAQHYGEGPIALKDVAERQSISKKYLEQVVAPLSSKGLLSVTRGYMGGYQLSRSPEKITLEDVVSASEDGAAPSRSRVYSSLGLLNTCSAVPSSTARPPFITTMRSEM